MAKCGVDEGIDLRKVCNVTGRGQGGSVTALHCAQFVLIRSHSLGGMTEAHKFQCITDRSGHQSCTFSVSHCIHSSQPTAPHFSETPCW